MSMARTMFAPTPSAAPYSASNRGTRRVQEWTRQRTGPVCESSSSRRRRGRGKNELSREKPRQVGTSASSSSSSSSSSSRGQHRDLTREEVDELTSNLSLDELCAAAAAVRALGPNPYVVTFSPKVFVPLTRACRDSCGYCTFAADPTDVEEEEGEGERVEPSSSSSPPAGESRVYMSVDEVLAIAEAGRRAGATECLFTLGDRPEARYPVAARELRAMGHASTVDYLAHCAALVLRNTGLLPHCNAGVLTRDELRKLRAVSASQGLMLETAAERLALPGAAHDGCDSKRPAVRLNTTRLAGELRIPFTSGVLIGIGETREERLDALFAIRESDRAHGGHIQARNEDEL